MVLLSYPVGDYLMPQMLITTPYGAVLLDILEAIKDLTAVYDCHIELSDGDQPLEFREDNLYYISPPPTVEKT